MEPLTKHEIKAWKDFSSGRAFLVGLQWLRDYRMPTVTRGTSEGMIFDAGSVAGYAKALKDVEHLGEDRPVERSADQPGLEHPPV